MDIIGVLCCQRGLKNRAVYVVFCGAQERCFITGTFQEVLYKKGCRRFALSARYCDNAEGSSRVFERLGA